MNLARMMTDRFFIEDGSGARRGPFKTKFGGNSIMVFHNDLEIAVGDRIIRPLPDGGEHVYVVEHCALHAGSRNIPSHLALCITDAPQNQRPAVPAMPAGAHAASGSPQAIAASLESLAQAIERTDFPAEHKHEARTLLRALRENPVVSAAVAGALRNS